MMQMASALPCHIVLAPGCAAADMKGNLFVGLSPYHTERPFKDTPIRLKKFISVGCHL